MKKIFVFIFSVLFVFVAFCQLESFAVTRWKFIKKIRVYIPEHEDSSLLQKSFEAWSEETENKIRFYYVPRANSADIEVRFVEKIEEPIDELTIGLTRLTKYGDTIDHAIIWIADKTLAGTTLSRDVRYVVMVHEVGHAIGLKHTNEAKSVMFPGAIAGMKIMPSDIENLNRIYDW